LDIGFDLSDQLLNMKDADDPHQIPKKHKFSISDLSHQHLGVLSSANGTLI